MDKNLARGYLGVTAVLVPFIALLVVVSRRPATPLADDDALVAPVLALVGLTFAILLLAAVVRNVAVARGSAAMRYYQTYRDDGPAESIERPAKTYDNLLQLPVLFYLVCVLTLITGSGDSVQLALAWIFVATRVAHAIVYIAFNVVPYRFAAFFCGVVTLATIWVRFAAAVL